MKNSLKPVFIVLIAAVLLSVVLNLHSNAKEMVPWRHDLAAAQEEARRAKKPLFIEFSATWCGPCQSMAHSTWADKKVAAALEEMVPVQIDIDAHGEIAREYGVNPIPAYVIADASGHVLKSGEGFREPEEFLAWLHDKSDGLKVP